MRRYDKGKRPYDRQDQRRGYPESDAYEPERGNNPLTPQLAEQGLTCIYS